MSYVPTGFDPNQPDSWLDKYGIWIVVIVLLVETVLLITAACGVLG